MVKWCLSLPVSSGVPMPIPRDAVVAELDTIAATLEQHGAFELSAPVDRAAQQLTGSRDDLLREALLRAEDRLESRDIDGALGLVRLVRRQLGA